MLDPSYSTDVSSCGASVTSSQARRYGAQKAPSTASSSSGGRYSSRVAKAPSLTSASTGGETRASSSVGVVINASSARADSHARDPKKMMEACLSQQDEAQHDRLAAMLRACEGQQSAREDSFNLASAKLAEYKHSWKGGGDTGLMFADRDASDGPLPRSLARTTRKDDPQGFLSVISVPSNGKTQMYFDL